MKRMMITAHSGCEGTPDNSVESILKGMELGADCVEIDIRQDDKGGLWLTHDALCDDTSAVSLEEAFSVIRTGRVCVNCDLKESGVLYPVLELAQRCGILRERLILSGSVDVKLLQADHDIVRRARIFLNSEELYRGKADNGEGTREEHTAYICENIEEVAVFLKELGVEALNAPYRYLSHEQIAAIRDAGIALSLWTVNDEVDQIRMMREELLNMTTRSVQSAVRLRNL